MLRRKQNRAIQMAATALFLCPMISAEVLVGASRAAEILQQFRPQPAATLACDFTPVKAAIAFTFRFQAGYLARAPLSQFHGPGHWMAVLLRITPGANQSQPVYLLRTFDLPDVPETDFGARLRERFWWAKGITR